MDPKGCIAIKSDLSEEQKVSKEKEWLVKGASIGDQLWIRPLRKSKGQVLRLEKQSKDHIEAKCSSFGCVVDVNFKT